MSWHRGGETIGVMFKMPVARGEVWWNYVFNSVGHHTSTWAQNYSDLLAKLNAKSVIAK